MLRRVVVVAVLGCAFAAASGAAADNWAAPQIRAVTQAGVLGTSVSGFAPQSPLTQGQLEAAIGATNALQHPPAPAQTPVTLSTTVGPGAVVAGTIAVDVEATGRPVDHVAFAVDGAATQTELLPPYALTLDTLQLPDGVHSLAVNVA